MSSLFSDLPPESADKHAREAVENETSQNKRQKVHNEAKEDVQVKSRPTSQDAVATALIKIAGHISSQKKFAKASELLRQLIMEHKIGEEHSKLVFEVCL